MEHIIAHQCDDEYLEFLKNLRELSKYEMVDIVGEFWWKLKKTAENNYYHDEDGYSKIIGGVQLTQVNRLKYMILNKG